MIVIVQPWFSAVGHPAQSIINLAKIIGNNNRIIYLTSIMTNNNSILESCNKLKLLGKVVDYSVKTPSIREGTIKALTALRKMIKTDKSINGVFFLDAHLVLLSALWLFYAHKNIRHLGVVYLMGPERITRYAFIKYLIARFLRRNEVVLFLRTDELVTDWKMAFPNAKIKCLPTLEIPFEENVVNKNPLPSKLIRLGVVGQIRTGKSLEWLVPIFKNNPSLGKLSISGAFSQPVEKNLKKLLESFNGFKENYLEESELLKFSSEQDYLLMLYDNWDSRMEGAVMYIAARVNRPVIVYDKGWCGRMVRTYKNGLLVPQRPEDFIKFVQSLPSYNSKEYQNLLKGVTKFRNLHSGQNVRTILLKELEIE